MRSDGDNPRIYLGLYAGTDNKEQGVDMSSYNEKLIAVIGATGRQAGAVVRALQAGGQLAKGGALDIRVLTVAAVYDRRRCRAHESPAVIDRRYSQNAN